MRIPYSTKKFDLQTLKQYEEIARWICEGKVISITSALVSIEYDKHYSNIRKSLLDEQYRRVKGIKDFTQYLSNNNKVSRINNAVDNLKIQTRFETLASLICKNTILMRQESKYAKFADYRTRHKMAPASNKGEYKDCYIWGTFLSVLRQLRSNAFTCFITTNPRDYAPKNIICTDITVDCNNVNTELCLYIGSLYGKLKRIVQP